MDDESTRLGYGYRRTAGRSSIVYAEAQLPANRTQAAQPDSAFANIDYAVYLDTAGGIADLAAREHR